ncbi:glycosyltransferase [Bacillus sp. OK048]|uniref:glycosyltransferase n=1 Tax=Bacillus sp. OK048 TaxID=1882761 RepID=UPI000888EA06|nr:glycosyltransferase [Bacillus sp. OK048]SDM70187.1 Glycosyl transferase family 2 [Bacillus sp. OK048]
MKMTMVVVFYRQKPEESKTVQTLKHTLLVNKDCLNEIEMIFYDNSPESQAISPSDYEGIHISYVHDPRNLGIAPAYNHAWTVAKENGSKWLLLLDHDTELTEDYFKQVLNLPELDRDVAAVVPKIVSENTMISPVFSHSLRPLQGERPTAGLQKQPVMAINSGSLISVPFLNEINGFNESFPLDYLDHWLFFEIYNHERMVWLVDVSLEHELSVMDYSRVSLKRYQSILDSEMNFYKKYKRDIYSSYRVQLVKRLLKQVVTVKNKKIAMYTFKRLLSK